MKQPELTLQILLVALKRRWKSYLAIVLVCTALGGGLGVWYAPKAEVSGGWEAQPLAETGFSQLPEDASYYAACRDLLGAAYGNTKTYLDTLAVVSLPEAEKEAAAAALGALRVQLNDWKRERYQPINDTLSTPGRLFLPVSAVEEETVRYTSLLETARQDLLQAEAAAELIRVMDAPDASDESINSVYYELLYSANQYAKLQRQIPQYEETLRQLQEDAAGLAANRREMDKMLKDATTHLSAIQSDVLKRAETLAEENALRFEVTYGAPGTETANTAEVALLHTYRPAQGTEAIAAFTLLFALLGISGGGFFIVCRELRAPAKPRGTDVASKK